MWRSTPQEHRFCSIQAVGSLTPRAIHVASRFKSNHGSREATTRYKSKGDELDAEMEKEADNFIVKLN
jgi:hypothetical protein